MGRQSWSGPGLACLVALVLTGCRSPSRTSTPADHGHRAVAVPWGATIYEYAETIVTYPPLDRGAYVVELEASREGDDVRGRLPAAALDDVVGDHGHVVRLSEAERAAMAGTPGVRELRPLQPHERQAARQAAADGEVRIDLFADTSKAEADALETWILAAGGHVSWLGPTALVASLPPDKLALVPRLSPVRWVE